MKRGIKGFVIKLKYAWFAIRQINRPHLGDIVIYKKTECFLIQGVMSPYWDLLPINEMVKQNQRTIWKHVHESDFKLEPIWKRFKKSFLFTYNFYMGYWYTIDLMYPITKGVGNL